MLRFSVCYFDICKHKVYIIPMFFLEDVLPHVPNLDPEGNLCELKGQNVLSPVSYTHLDVYKRQL